MIDIYLQDAHADFLKVMLKKFMASQYESEASFKIVTCGDEAGFVEIEHEGTGKTVCKLPDSMFSSTFLTKTSINVKLVPQIETYSGTDYPKGFKSLMKHFLDDFVSNLLSEITESRTILTVENIGGAIRITSDRYSMSLFDFVPKNFDGILDEEDDCVDFILVLEPVFEVK